MAEVAIALRESISEGLNREKGKGPLNALLTLIKEELVGEATEDEFADMCAQTITYGLLAARVQDPEGFGASPVLDYLPLNNEFLESLFNEVQDAITGLAAENNSLEALYSDLRATDVESILDQFGNTADGGDPVIHFYENFLAQYDNRIRLEAGAFYTPKTVVDKMVDLVDEILKDKFNLPLGLADSSSWEKVCRDLNLPIPDGIDPSRNFVSLLDPATGTGTYLMSAILRAKANLAADGREGETIDRSLFERVLPNFKAFELMLGPYSIANFKLGLALSEDRSFTPPKMIYLTNTLKLSPDSFDVIPEAETLISAEGHGADALKLSEPFTVILGNPPYLRETNNLSSNKAKGLGGVIRERPSSVFGNLPALHDFEKDYSAAGVPPTMKANILNLYVYFWRWSLWQVHQKFQDNQVPDRGFGSPGVVCFITGSSFIKTPSFVGFRNYLRQCYDEILVLDLGGSNFAGLSDPNIFDIQTPVAILIGVKYSNSTKESSVRYLRISGTREEKLAALQRVSFASGAPVLGSRFDQFMFEEATVLSDQPYLASLFGSAASGCKPGRAWVSSPSLKVLQRRWETLATSEESQRASLFRVGSAKTITSSPKSYSTGQPYDKTIALLSPDSQPESYVRYSYRPFDEQYLIRDARLLSQVSKLLLNDQPGQYFLGSGDSLSGGPSVILFRHLPDMPAFRGQMASKDFYPRFTDKDGKSNLSATGHKYATKMKYRNLEADFLGYIYGVHGTGGYFEVFKQALGLGLDRAKLPLTSSQAIYKSISEVGKALINQHYGETVHETGVTLKTFQALPLPVDLSPKKISYDLKSEMIRLDDFEYCMLPKEVWEFKANGLQIVKSWLENRKANPKGRRSSPLDDINEENWIFNEEFVKMIADVSAVIEAKKLVIPLLQKVAEELEAQPGK